jgi:branched-chain amino acid transport system substrate-binding protein
VDKINAAGGVNGQKLEVVAFDNKVNPQETLIILKKVFDEGIRYVGPG